VAVSDAARQRNPLSAPNREAEAVIEEPAEVPALKEGVAAGRLVPRQLEAADNSLLKAFAEAGATGTILQEGAGASADVKGPGASMQLAASDACCDCFVESGEGHGQVWRTRPGLEEKAAAITLEEDEDEVAGLSSNEEAVEGQDRLLLPALACE
jgi:hypothetical protein